jgi:hypothetical protein
MVKDEPKRLGNGDKEDQKNQQTPASSNAIGTPECIVHG